MKNKTVIARHSMINYATIVALLTLTPFHSIYAAEKYWVCGTGQWDTDCWSANGGTLDGLGQPLDGDNVYLHGVGPVNYQNTAYPSAVLNSLSIFTSFLQTRDNLQVIDEYIDARVTYSGGMHNVSNILIVSYNNVGEGNLTVTDTAELSAARIAIGATGGGWFGVLNGGTVTSTSSSVGIGTYSSVALVDGVGSTWDSGGLNVGSFRYGNSILTVQNGGKLMSSYVDASSGEVKVIGAGSSWINSGTMRLGGDRAGVLRVQNGAMVFNDTAQLGQSDSQTTSAGFITVDGPGSSMTNSGTLTIGKGSLRIENGGTVSNTVSTIGEPGYDLNGLIVFSASATVSGANSHWNNDAINMLGGLNVENNGTVTATNTINVGSKGLVNLTDGIIIASSVENLGEIIGKGLINADVINSGRIGPGNEPVIRFIQHNDPGILNIQGDLTQTLDGTLSMELGGLLAGTEYDVLNVAGIASLAGTLDIELINPLDPGGVIFDASLGDSFDILSAETFVGEFDFLNLTILGGGLDWKLDYLTDEIGTLDIARLSVVSDVPIPATIWLFSSGVLGLLVIARRYKK